MSVPFESILMRELDINYTSARNLASEGRAALRLERHEPWTDELFHRCVRMYGIKAKGRTITADRRSYGMRPVQMIGKSITSIIEGTHQTVPQSVAPTSLHSDFGEEDEDNFSVGSSSSAIDCLVALNTSAEDLESSVVDVSYESPTSFPIGDADVVEDPPNVQRQCRSPFAPTVKKFLAPEEETEVTLIDETSSEEDDSLPSEEPITSPIEKEHPATVTLHSASVLPEESLAKESCMVQAPESAPDEEIPLTTAPEEPERAEDISVEPIHGSLLVVDKQPVIDTVKVDVVAETKSAKPKKASTSKKTEDKPSAIHVYRGSNTRATRVVSARSLQTGIKEEKGVTTAPKRIFLKLKKTGNSQRSSGSGIFKKKNTRKSIEDEEFGTMFEC